MQSAIEEAGKCIKRQKTCASKGEATVSQLIAMVDSAKRELESGKASDPEATLAQLHKAIEEAGLLKELNSSTKEFHTSIAKLGKVRVGRESNAETLATGPGRS